MYLFSFFRKNDKLLLLLSWLFCLPLFLQGQKQADIIEMPARAIGLTPTELTLFQGAFKQLPPSSNYAYVAVHADVDKFKIFENGSWITISHSSLAKWITDNDALYKGKTIVLLSCNNAASSQKLANVLAEYDIAAKRPIRNVIGWDETVFLYENGYIDGYGNCRIFAPSGVPPVVIPPGATPLGNPSSYPSEDLKAIILAKPLQADLVQLCTRAKDSGLSLYLSFYNLQRNPNSQEVFKMIQNSDEHLTTWLYLRDIVTDNLKSSKPLIEGVSAIRSKYFSAAGYQAALEEFLQDGKKKVDCIQKLGANPALLSLTEFQKWLNECGLKRPIVPFLAALPIQPTTTGEINLAILKENEPKLVEAIKKFGVQKDLEDALKLVKWYVEQTPVKNPPANGAGLLNSLDLLKKSYLCG